MGTFGVNMNEIEGRAPGGWTPPDPGRQVFEIVSVNEGVNSKGEHAGERYLTVKCLQTSGEDPGTKSTSVYLGLSQLDGRYGKPIEQTVGWLKAWGRLDILEGSEDVDVSELNGTIFEADVKIKTNADSDVKVNLQNVLPISHAEVEPPKPEPAKGMRRGR